MWPNPQETEDLATFAEETLNGKLHFFAVIWGKVEICLNQENLWKSLNQRADPR